MRATYYLLLVLSFATDTASYGQQVELVRFSAFAHSQSVQLDWTIGAGSFCDGTTIFRSEDDITYHEVGMIDGICGSADEPVGYSFKDSMPIENRRMYKGGKTDRLN